MRIAGIAKPLGEMVGAPRERTWILRTLVSLKITNINGAEFRSRGFA